MELRKSVRGGLLTMGVAAALALVGCGGDDGGSNKTRLDYEATVAHGAVKQADCVMLGKSGTQYGDPVQSNDDGIVSFDVKVPKNDFPVQVECTGGNYYNEATGQDEPLTGKLRSLIPDKETLDQVGKKLGVTPLTDMAAELYAKTPAANKDPVAAKQALESVRKAIAPDLGVDGTDLLSAPQPVKSQTDVVGGGTAGKYATYLAGLAKAANDEGKSPEQLLGELNTQVQQGAVDATVSQKVVAKAKEFAEEQGDDDAKAAVANDEPADEEDTVVETPTGSTGGAASGS